jgi:hypothetical protein
MKKLALLAALMLVGCGDKGGTAAGGGGSAGGGYDSPEAVGKALLAAFNSKDPAALTALFPTDEQLKKAATCTDETKSLATYIGKQKVEMIKEVGGDKFKDVKFEYAGLEPKEGGQKLAKGALDADTTCTASEDIEIARQNLKFKVVSPKGTEDENEGVKMVKLGGKWYLMDM